MGNYRTEGKLWKIDKLFFTGHPFIFQRESIINRAHYLNLLRTLLYIRQTENNVNKCSQEKISLSGLKNINKRHSLLAAIYLSYNLLIYCFGFNTIKESFSLRISLTNNWFGYKLQLNVASSYLYLNSTHDK